MEQLLRMIRRWGATGAAANARRDLEGDRARLAAVDALAARLAPASPPATVVVGERAA